MFWKSGPWRSPPNPPSPLGSSILTTSAPQSASWRTQVGPARTRERSITLKRDNGSLLIKFRNSEGAAQRRQPRKENCRSLAERRLGRAGARAGCPRQNPGVRRTEGGRSCNGHGGAAYTPAPPPPKRAVTLFSRAGPGSRATKRVKLRLGFFNVS